MKWDISWGHSLKTQPLKKLSIKPNLENKKNDHRSKRYMAEILERNDDGFIRRDINKNKIYTTIPRFPDNEKIHHT